MSLHFDFINQGQIQPRFYPSHLFDRMSDWSCLQCHSETLGESLEIKEPGVHCTFVSFS